MKKNIVLLIILCLLSLIFIYTKYTQTSDLENKKYELKDTSGIAIMIYDESKKDYVANDTVPVGNYKINTERTYCINGGNIASYNNQTGKVTYRLASADQCFVYFDLVNLTATFTVDSTGAIVTYNVAMDSSPIKYILKYRLSSGGAYTEVYNDMSSTGTISGNVTPGIGTYVFVIEAYDTSNSLIATHTSATITVTAEAQLNPTLSDTVLALGDGSERTSSQSSGGVYRVINQNGYRYEGKNPDNYVTFNNETAGWRIIGTFEGSTIGLESGKYYTKLIKNTSIGNMAWDSNNLNNWKNATLNTYLNATYLSTLSAVDDMIVTPTYYLGAHSTSDVYTPAMYGYERGSTVAGASGSVASINDKKIGLMYPSDYGYAAYSTTCDNTSTKTLYNYEANSKICASVDWLYLGSSEWTITPYSGNTYNAFYVNSTGYVSISGVSNARAVRPVLYLSATTLVSDGDGSQSNPYVLS